MIQILSAHSLNLTQNYLMRGISTTPVISPNLNFSSIGSAFQSPIKINIAVMA